jgi:hypothetical protein
LGLKEAMIDEAVDHLVQLWLALVISICILTGLVDTAKYSRIPNHIENLPLDAMDIFAKKPLSPLLDLGL